MTGGHSAMRRIAVARARRRAAPRSPAPLRVVAVGGGTGLPAVLGGLARAGGSSAPLRLSAVVTTCDDGGSSGDLRRRYGLPSPGDVRNCLVALAPGDNPLAEVFQHRFPGEGGLGGHAVGNLVLAALAQRLGDFGEAVEAARRLLGARGRVWPSTTRRAELVATLADGRVVRGETAIAAARGRVARLALERPVPASPEARRAVAEADLVVLGPGSLYSSIIAALLPDGMAEALAACRGRRVLVMNLVTQPGETDGYDAADHLRAIHRHAGPVVDVVLAHGRPLPERLVSAYAAEGARPVSCDREALAGLGVSTVAIDALVPGAKARHDRRKLAAALLDIALRKGGDSNRRGDVPCAESSATSAGERRPRFWWRVSGVSSTGDTTARAPPSSSATAW